MRLLVTFGAVCVALVASVAWLVFPVGGTGGLSARRAAAEATQTTPLVVEGNRAGPARDDSVQIDEQPPLAATTSPASSVPSQAAVHWAGDPAHRPAARRLALAVETLRGDPEHPAALHDMAAALAELGRWSEAADVLARLRELNPDEVELRFELATALIQARRWVAAGAELRAVVAAQPDHNRAWFDLAVAEQAIGHLAAARTAWDRVLALQPTADAFARRGEVLLDLRDWAAAAEDFAAALREQPDAEDAVLNRALALVRIDGHVQARTELAAFDAAHSCRVAVLNRLGELAWTAYQESPGERAAEREGALRWWRESLACDPAQADIRAAVEGG